MGINRYFNRNCVEQKAPLVVKRKHRVWDHIYTSLMECLEDGFGLVETDIGDTGAVYDCDASIEVGAAVYIDSDAHVALAIASPTGHPAIGVVVEKINPTRVRVVSDGGINVFAGLLAGETYVLSMSVAGAVVTPAHSFGPPDSFNQRIGVASSPTSMQVDPDDEPAYFS